MISERQNNTEDTTIQSDEEYNNLLSNLSSNVTELESLFNYAKNLFTQPITSVNTLDRKSIQSNFYRKYICIDKLFRYSFITRYHPRFNR